MIKQPRYDSICPKLMHIRLQSTEEENMRKGNGKCTEMLVIKAALLSVYSEDLFLCCQTKYLAEGGVY